ncbi:Holliday junction DNA helicase RuvA [Candidatus Peregrinibacteria bacterium RIFOXYB2_FULL_32_7]|nr:MAG: Holliday junction DNA helicase RuvA [Candidatus Peregrinibacteria bacterium RIFOXYB2_FULL_32_7]
MISFLSGIVLALQNKNLILDVNGVGYEVFTTNEILSQNLVNQELKLFIHTSVKEDSITLFGMKNLSELQFFKQLISVSGIGPKTALEILNQPIEFTKTAIFTQDITMLTKIPGLGKKTAERLILELKNKIQPEILDNQTSQGISANALFSNETKEAIEALESLGYKRYEIVKTFQNLEKEILKSEEMIKWFLTQV